MSKQLRKYDKQFKVVFDANRELMKLPAPKQRQLEFRTEGKK